MKNFKEITTFFIALLLFVGSVSAQKFNSTEGVDNFSVKFTGTEDNYLTFLVEINGLNNNKSILKISDKTEGELYTQNWKIKAPFQIFKIEKKDGQQLIFNLETGDKEFTKTFSATTRLVEKTTVQENGFVVFN